MTPTLRTGVQDTTVLEQCSHIVAGRHDGLRAAFPRIEALLDAVVGAHGADHPELRDLQRAFQQFRAELEPHLRSEEELLFPAFAALERQGRPVEEALLAAHERDHVSVGDGLVALRILAAGYDPRHAVCSTHRTLLEALAAFELDLRRALDEENDLLFPHVRRMGRQTDSEHARLAAESGALPRCCQAWIGEQAHAWAVGALKPEGDDAGTIQPPGLGAG
jgi:regulator of cell morphogenesis and NO signaling